MAWCGEFDESDRREARESRGSPVGVNRLFNGGQGARLSSQGGEWRGKAGSAEIYQALDAPIKIATPAKAA
jgi:hypothetical protein